MNERTLEFTEELVAKETAEAEAAARNAATVRQCDLSEFADWDRQNCYECLDPLPSQRIDAGRVRCVACQTAEEMRAAKARKMREWSQGWA